MSAPASPRRRVSEPSAHWPSSRSQAAAPRDDKGFDRIGLSLRVEGDWPQLVALLRDLPRQRPVIHTGTLQLGVQQQGMRDAPQVVFGQFDLYVLKERRP